MFIADVTQPAVRFLLAQPWMAGLPEDVRQRVVESAYRLPGNKGEAILRSGEPVKGWYAVLHGLVKLQTQSAEGWRQAFLGIPAGEWFGARPRACARRTSASPCTSDRSCGAARAE